MTSGPDRRLSAVPDLTLFEDPDGAEDLEIELSGLDDLTPVELFAPLVADAEREIRRARTAIDAELAASGLIGVLGMGMAEAPAPPDVTPDQMCDVLLAQLVAQFEVGARPAGLAMLRALSVVGPDLVRPLAHEAAVRMVGAGVKDRAWVKQIGAPRPGRAWCYGDIMGDQEALTLTFHYGRREHALNVLIDNDLGGGIKDCWVGADAEQVWQRVHQVAEDPRAEIETLPWPQAVERLVAAAAAPRCAVQPDQLEDVAMSEAVLQARLAFLDGQIRRPDLAFGDPPR